MKMDYAAATHVGQRTNNEDSYSTNDPYGLYIVADGMGGYEGGEIASQLTIRTMSDFFSRNTRDQDITWPYRMDSQLSLEENMMQVAVRLAHREVCSQKQGRLKRMGSTVAALYLHRDRAVVGHVGDSRVYRLRSNKLEAMTRDHSLYAQLLESGQEHRKRQEFAYANVITRAIGGEGENLAVPDLRTELVVPGDTFLLCSDGLIEQQEDSDMEALLRSHSPAEAVPRLVQRALDQGGKDNVTCIVVHIAEP